MIEAIQLKPLSESVAEYINLGFSIIPLATDNRPLCAWKKHQREQMTIEQYESYNSPSVGVVCGEISDNLFVFDFDLKYDLTGDLYQRFIESLSKVNPTIISKVQIHTTKSNGFHWLCKTETKPLGNMKFASRPATPEEQVKGEKVKVLIESRGEGGYIAAPPSKGYSVFQKGMQTLTDKEMQQLIDCAKSFDLMEQVKTSAPKAKTTIEGVSPLEDYNQRGDCLQELVSHGWTRGISHGDNIDVKRPGTSTAKSSGNYSTSHKKLWVHSTSTEFEANISHSPSDVYAILNHDGNKSEAAKALLKLGFGSPQINTLSVIEGSELPCFYSEKTDSKGNRKVSIIVSELADYLHKEGFRIYQNQFIKVADNIAELAEEKTMYQLALAHVKTFKDAFLVSDFIQKGASLILTQKGTVLSLETITEGFQRDSKDEAYFYFKNSVVAITKDAVKLKPYSEIESIIWKSKIIDREFTKLPPEETSKSMYATFLLNATGDEDNNKVFKGVIGRLLHRYKSPVNVKAPIINDMSTNEDGSPAGGTGKGLVIDAPSKIVEVLNIDGKRVNIKTDKFALQAVKPTTDIIHYNDASKGFDAEILFSTQTSDMEIERKGKDKINIPYKESPLFAITTNYGLKGVGSSHKRRKHEVYLTNHYSHTHTPFDEFGCEFFHDWDAIEYNRFDNYMISCLQEYLSNGLTIYENEKTQKAALIKQIGIEFWEAMEGDFGTVGFRHIKGRLYERLTSDNKFLQSISYKKIRANIDLYAQYKGYRVEHSDRSTGGVRFYTFFEIDEQGNPIEPEITKDF